MANFKDKTVYLENDLDLGGHEWISIGDGANTAGGSFQGVFDGQSHVVYNLYSHEGLKSENKDNNNNLYRNGLFGAIYNATVQNLGIENADIVIPMKVNTMPRMPKYLKREWAFFLDERGRKKYNELCRNVK